MPDKPAFDYATPASTKPFKSAIVVLPMIIAAGPIVIAFFAFSFGYGGMAIAALALLSGFLLSPIAAIWSIINCILFRRDRLALILSLSAILVAAGALAFEIWRLNGQWD